MYKLRCIKSLLPSSGSFVVLNYLPERPDPAQMLQLCRKGVLLIGAQPFRSYPIPTLPFLLPCRSVIIIQG